MRMSDWSSDVCSSDLVLAGGLFLAGSLACAVAPNMPVLLATRTVQGFGGGLIVAQSMALVSELYSTELRKLMLASISGMWATAAQIGRASCRERGCKYV